MKVHPVADLFPMLADDELAELAADIKQRGLLQPIVVDEDGTVLDGRNRLAACKLAGVQPVFHQYDGDDPDGYALAVNVARRHMTQGQRAIVVARSFKLKERGAGVSASEGMKINAGRLSQAKLIEEVSPELSEQILSGAKPFDAAYKEAQEMRKARKEAEKKRARLREEAEDLLALVDEERMSLDEATGAMEARQSEEKKRAQEQAKIDREHAARVSESLRGLVRYGAEGLSGAGLREEYAKIYQDGLGAGPEYPVNEETIRTAGESLLALAEIWKEHRP